MLYRLTMIDTASLESLARAWLEQRFLTGMSNLYKTY